MMATIRSVKHNGVWLTFCALCGVLGAMFFPATLENVRDSYDTTHPVWQGVVAHDVKNNENNITFRLSGEKVRDCRFLRIIATIGYVQDGVADASITRTDKPMVGINRPLGKQELGTYEVWPTRKEARFVFVRAEHECDMRVVSSKLATVVLN